jgi:hypothetical protein
VTQDDPAFDHACERFLGKRVGDAMLRLAFMSESSPRDAWKFGLDTVPPSSSAQPCKGKVSTHWHPAQSLSPCSVGEGQCDVVDMKQVFMGVAATGECTGSAFHVHGPFIPTPERARPDFQVGVSLIMAHAVCFGSRPTFWAMIPYMIPCVLQDLHFGRWNAELLRMSGHVARVCYTSFVKSLRPLPVFDVGNLRADPRSAFACMDGVSDCKVRALVRQVGVSGCCFVEVAVCNFSVWCCYLRLTRDSSAK